MIEQTMKPFQESQTKKMLKSCILDSEKKSGLKRELTTRPRAFLRVFGLRFIKNTVVVCCPEAFLRDGEEATLHSPRAGCWSSRVASFAACCCQFTIAWSVALDTSKTLHTNIHSRDTVKVRLKVERHHFPKFD